MSQTETHECTNCCEPLTLEARNYRYVESDLPNVILQGAQSAECPRCGNEDLMLPRLIAIREAIASALVNSPARLTGPQLKFLRKHLELSDEELGKYLHTGADPDRTISGPPYSNARGRAGQGDDSRDHRCGSPSARNLRPQWIGVRTAHRSRHDASCLRFPIPGGVNATRSPK